MTDPAARKLVLIVDDAPSNISVISSLLKDTYRTRIATSGERALAIASGDEKPDLILLDVSMPEMSGYEVCRRLKAGPATREIPIIFLTASTDDESETKGFAVGAADYIRKPFAAPIVLARVNTQIALRTAIETAREAQHRADRLLRALLPETVAEEINSIGTVIPRRREMVAVLFCDVVDFTAFCERNTPEDVISRLDVLFVLLEQIARSFGLEKIKTVGDAFMAAAGLLNNMPNPLEAAVRCAVAMLDAVKTAGLGWELRVGVNAGPIVAGVVGEERFQFDVWGDTVNVAARLTAMPHPGGIAVSEENWRWIAEHFTGEPRGKLEMKGKGLMSVFEVRTAKP